MRIGNDPEDLLHHAAQGREGLRRVCAFEHLFPEHIWFELIVHHCSPVGVQHSKRLYGSAIAIASTLPSSDISSVSRILFVNETSEGRELTIEHQVYVTVPAPKGASGGLWIIDIDPSGKVLVIDTAQS